ncbi:MAG: 4Fe-4S dicluster domain-containing protein [Oligoflexales bacterium]|nr:4Fe-4S dicluster domain-containing protein [Oligoflexales bacterium]
MSDRSLTEVEDALEGSTQSENYEQQLLQDRLDRGGKEVFAPVNQPFEAPAKTIEKGPLYIDAEEVMPELAAEISISDNILKDLSSSPSGLDRRDFLRLFGSTAALGTTAAACVRRPEESAVPYAKQPADQVPGRPAHYATTCGECSAGCGVIVNVREGRPVKLEGSQGSAISQGKLCALGQGSIQGLYHPERRTSPAKKVAGKFENISWDEVYKDIGSKLKDAKNVAIITGAATGNRHEFFKHFLKTIGSSEDNLFIHDSNVLLSSITAAHQIAFGTNAIPRADLRKANVIVGIGTDFLDIGVQPVYYQAGFSFSQHFSNQGVKGKFIQLEAVTTLTGTKASERIVIPPGSETLVALYLAETLMALPTNKAKPEERAVIQSILDKQRSELNTAPAACGIDKDTMGRIANELLSTGSIVMVGGSNNFDSNSSNLQLIGILLNLLVGAYGNTLELDKAWITPAVKVGDMRRFLNAASNIDVVIVIDNDPAFTLPNSYGFKTALSKVKTVVSIQYFPNETEQLSHYALPGHHYLESWGDEQPVAGYWSFRQPVVRSTTNSKQAEDILIWLGAHLEKPMGVDSYQTYVKHRWQLLFKSLEVSMEPWQFENGILRKGVFGKPDTATIKALANFKDQFEYRPFKTGLRLISPLDVRLRDGRGAHLPVLQEVGDSMTTIAWDSWVALNPNTAKKLGFKRNELLKVSTSEGELKVALYPMPGLHPDAVVIQRGNGLAHGVSKITDGNGVNPLPLFAAELDGPTGMPATAGMSVTLEKTGEMFTLAAMQKHSDLANRTDIVRKTTLDEARANVGKTKNLDQVPDLYPELPKGEYRWGMTIDLDRCNGCGACMVACAVENNVPQIGREQILMGREMHWIRLDRYFEGSPDNPEVTFQPIMCQHCNHAPCEAVCPVYATTHDPEGVNAMTYNRCVGTRYCANACPYKVRRFNWWTHKWGQIGDEKHQRNLRAMNPDVTVRTRGVMEKCNFCYQRIRASKHEAKYLRNGSKVRDGRLQTACQQTCPANAIVFGDLSDQRTMAARARSDNRAYLALGGDPSIGEYGLKTLPNVSYLAKVTTKKIGAGQSHE